MFHFLKFSALAAVLSVAVAAPVFATPVSLRYLGAEDGYRGVIVREAPVKPAGGWPSVRVYAGGFSMRDTSGNSGLGDFIAWCLDIAHWLGTDNQSYAYTLTSTPFSNSYGLDANQTSRVQGYFDANYQTYLNNKTRNTSAGFQVGLWEVLYDDDYSLSANTSATDEFRVTARNTNGSLAAVAEANSFLAAAQGYSGSKMWNLNFLESNTTNQQRQNLVTVSAVPLPGAIILLLAGLVGLGVLSRRRRAS